MKTIQETKIVRAIAPAAIVDDDDFAGAYDDTTPVNIDTLGWNHLDVFVHLGATDIAIAEMSLYECDTSNGTFTQVSGSDFNVASTLPSATEDNGFFAWHVPLGGARKRYLQVNLKAGNGSTGTYAVAWGVLSQPNQAPSSATERGLTREVFV